MMHMYMYVDELTFTYLIMDHEALVSGTTTKPNQL